LATTRLPAYVQAKRLATGKTAYFWVRPRWAHPDNAKSEDPKKRRLAVRNGRLCPVESEPLGTDAATAIQKGQALTEAFRGWCAGIDSAHVTGTVRWLFAWYKDQDEYTGLSYKSRKGYAEAMEKVAEMPMKLGVFGDKRARAIDAEIADKLYTRARKKHGERMGAMMMQIARRAWNLAGRRTRETGIRLNENPFAKMGIATRGKAKPGGPPRGNAAATRAQFDAYRAAARAMGRQSMATAAALCFEGCQRVWDAFGFVDPDTAANGARPARGIKWEGYRPGEYLELIQSKTGNYVQIPLSDTIVIDGKPERIALYPELEEELARSAAAERARTGKDPAGVIVRDERTGRPYTVDYMGKLHRRIRDKAALPAEVRFTSFRHGGTTEIGDAGEADPRAATGHTTLDTTAIYNKANLEKARRIALLRRQHVAMLTAGEEAKSDD
jgi:hypothetical protein